MFYRIVLFIVLFCCCFLPPSHVAGKRFYRIALFVVVVVVVLKNHAHACVFPRVLLKPVAARGVIVGSFYQLFHIDLVFFFNSLSFNLLFQAA